MASAFLEVDMATRVIIVTVLWVVCLLITALTPAEGGEEMPTLGGNVRPSILEGRWYPKDPMALSKMVEGFLKEAGEGVCQGRLMALVVPHAGYVYSGQVAAHGYALLKGLSIHRVILVGPSHRARFSGVSVNLQGGYETPLGVVPVDQPFGKRLIHESNIIRWIPKAHGQEHSLEIQLPFLQKVVPSFQIVPILMGTQNWETCRILSQAIIKTLGPSPGTLLLASTDLSHFHSYTKAKALDRIFIDLVRNMEPRALSSALSQRETEACGGGPTVTVLLAAREVGAKRACILSYANSGDVTGDHSRVVGYLSAAITIQD
jgi:AmmeMemoRadiSam system protein B